MANEYLNRFFEKFEFEGLTFDDVLLLPGESEIVPINVNLETMLSTNIPMKIPMVSADMSTVTEFEMARAVAMEGGIGFLWKHEDIRKQESWVKKVKYTFNAKVENPVTIKGNQTLKEVTKLLEKYENKFSSLVVIDDEKKVIGLLTKDKTQFGNNEDLVKNLMVTNPKTSEKEFDVKEAYNFMKKNQIPKLIIVSKKNKLEGLYCFKDVKEIVEGITPLYNRDVRGQLRVGANIGIHDYERAERLLRKNCDVLLVGTAHGHSKNVIDTVKELKTKFSEFEFDIIAGNVATYEGAKKLFESGANAVKVGIGPGTICTTRVVSGAGRAQITAIYDAVRATKKYENKYIIADGGIRDSGDITKALAAGANCIMAGSLFAGTDESPGEIIIDEDKNRVKKYIGMGSSEQMTSSEESKERYKQKGVPKEKLVAEGISSTVPYKGPVSKNINRFMGGLRSGMGYVGAKNINELQEKAKFDKITVAGLRESYPHDVKPTKSKHD